MTTHVVALSGGKDSTAMALRLAEIEPQDYVYLCTPTGDELPEMEQHWERLACLLGTPLTRLQNGTLRSWTEHFQALPSWRMRWCTRLLKIEPCLDFVRTHAPVTLYVGLRADEPDRAGLYGDLVGQYRYPLREWGWSKSDVKAYLLERKITIPARTDCARCYGQRLYEWRRLWQEHPEIYEDAEAQERATGFTFRSPARDSWPTALADLRQEFEHGRLPPKADDQLSLFEEDNDESQGACRVCRM